MKTLEQLIEQLIATPEADWKPEIERWRDEAKATLSEEEYDELLSGLKVDNLIRELIAKRLQDKGARPEQKVGEVITKQDVADIMAAVRVMPQESDTKH
jgi:hypothetical protein